MKASVFYFPFYVLLHLLFHSFLSSILPTFSKLLSFCHFLQKEKGFHSSLCVRALGHPSSPVSGICTQRMEAWTDTGSGKPISESVKRRMYFLSLAPI